MEYDWSRSNIRELFNVVFTAVDEYIASDYLSPQHITLPVKRISKKNSNNTEVSSDFECISNETNGHLKIDQLLELLQSYTFVKLTGEQLIGKLPQLEGVCAELLAKLLETILKITGQPTVDTPEGEIKIHRALKLATGDAKFTASKSADKIKKILSMPYLPSNLIKESDVLSAALEKSLKLRPKTGKNKDKK